MQLDALPTEILLETLGHLDYQDLKVTIPLLNSGFAALVAPSSSPTSATQIDKILFRDAPRVTQGLEYSYHPYFCLGSEYNPYIETSIEDLRLPDGRKLIETDVCNENAVSPAITKVVYTPELSIGWLREPVEIQGTGPGGAVTVLDVMKIPVEQAERWSENGYGNLPKSWKGLRDLEVKDGVAYFTNRFCITWPFKYS